VENTVRRHGYEYHNRFEAETLSLCLELARRGLGYTVMPYCALHGQLEEGSALSAAPIDKLSVTWALHVNRAREHAVVVRSLASALRNFISDQLKSGEWRFGEMVRTSESRRQVKVAESH
jgi:LysR family nitrogen assimilation transcriptional regulator